MKKGAVVVEFAVLAFVVLSVSLFFWSLNTNIANTSELEMLIYESVNDIRDELYIYSKVQEYMEINSNLDDLIAKVERFIHLDIDEDFVKNTINSNILNVLIEKKIRGRHGLVYPIDIKEKYHLRENPKVVTSTKNGNLAVETHLKFDLPSIIPFLDKYEACIYYEVGCRNIDQILFGGDANQSASSGSNQNNTAYLTQHGILSSHVFHTNRDCFGLRSAREVLEVKRDPKTKSELQYEGKHYFLCPFCRDGKRYKQ